MRVLFFTNDKFGIGNKTEYLTICSIFRLLITIIAIIDFIPFVINFNAFFSTNAIIPIELGILDSEYYYYFKPIFKTIQHHLSYTNFYTILSVIYILLLIGTLLFGNKVIIFCLIIVQLLIFRSIPQYNYGYDNFITMSLFYCLLFPTNRKLILKKKKNTENIDKLNIHPYFNLIVFLKIHLCIVYFVSGVAKVVDINWWNGNAIMRAMATTTTEYVLPAILLAIISLLTVTIELIYPILAFSKYKKFLVLDIILLHIGIGFILGLSSFAAIMIVWNVVAFYKTLNFLKNYA